MDQKYPPDTADAGSQGLSSTMALSQQSRQQGGPDVEAAPTEGPIIRVKKWSHLDKASRLAIILIVLQAVVVTIIQAVAFVSASFGTRFDMQVYAGSYIWSMGYLVFIVVDAIFSDNTMQLIAFIILEVLVAGFGVYEAMQLPLPVFQVNIAVNAAFLLAFIVLLRYLILEFGWRVYRRVGADPNIQRLIRLYHAFVVVLKVAFLFTTLFLIQNIFILLGLANVEAVFNILVPPFFLGTWVVIIMAIRTEKRDIMTAYAVLTFLMGCYYLGKIIHFQAGADFHQGGKYANVGTVMITQSAAYCTALYMALAALDVVLLVQARDKNLGHHLARAEGEAVYSAATDSTGETPTGTTGRRTMTIIDD